MGVILEVALALEVALEVDSEAALALEVALEVVLEEALILETGALETILEVEHQVVQRRILMVPQLPEKSTLYEKATVHVHNKIKPVKKTEEDKNFAKVPQLFWLIALSLDVPYEKEQIK